MPGIIYDKSRRDTSMSLGELIKTEFFNSPELIVSNAKDILAFCAEKKIFLVKLEI